MKRKINFGLFIFFVVVSFLVNYLVNFESEPTFVDGTAYGNNSNLQVYYIDVGQGDSTLIKCNDEFMLIDSGEATESDKVVDFLKSKNVDRLKYVIATHPHSDHMGGMSEVINEFAIENIILPKATNNTKVFENMVLAIKNNNVKVITPKINEVYALGDSEFKILSPESIEYDNLNNYSVVVKLEYGKSSFIFTGDIEKLIENKLVESADLSATVLKVAHHGSDSSSTSEFIKEVNPTVSVISVGKGNDYGHPKEKVLKRIEEVSEHIYRTDVNGTIGIFTDGETLEVKTER